MRPIGVALIFTLGLLVSSSAEAVTRYLAPTGVGRAAADAGVTRADPMSVAYFKDTYASPDDLGLMQPGHYGTYPWNVPFFTSTCRKGSAGHPIVYRQDPATCTPRSADWWSRETVLESPDPAQHVVFGTLTFGAYPAAPPNYETAGSYYITLDGIWIDQGYLLFNIDVADVNIVNATIFATLTNKDTTSDGSCVSFRYYGAGSDYHNIHIEDGYFYGGKVWMEVAGHMKGGNEIIHCRGWSNGSGLAYRPQSTVEGDPVLFRRCTIDYQAMIGEYLDPGVLTHTVATVDPLYPRRKFTIDSTAYPCVFADVNDADTGTLDYRYVSARNYAGTSFELVSDVTFDIEVGDKVRFTDGIHGSGIALRKGDVTLDGCMVWNMGATRLLYVYNDVPGPFPNVHILNCLFYGSLNLYTLDLDTARLGNGFQFINNTVVGNRGHTSYLDQLSSWAHYYTDLHLPQWHYGHAVDFGGYAAGTDTSTCIVANNLILGVAGGSTMGSTAVTGNTLYHDLTGGRFPAAAGNVTVYASEAWGSEPCVFDADGTYFNAVTEDFNDAFTTVGYTENLYADFMLKADAPAVGAADANYSPSTCISGWIRTDPCDVGAWEYGAVSPLAPTSASSPSPADHASLIRENTSLSWTTGGNSPTHHVFFGTDLDDVATGEGDTDQGTQSETTYDPTPGVGEVLAYGTTYYWRIQEENDDGNDVGDVWRFTTRPAWMPRHGLIGRKGGP